ncbi:site-specific DNA-methyltransferase [Dehalococcoidales bacterium]|nr:site-specific DNA-methyltransferase [Dehalococcoidales bacterium]
MGKLLPHELNDIDLRRWKDYTEIITDSLWLFPERFSEWGHTPEYWGNFIPQIATQAILRFTKKGETVLDGFLGLGTTLIECKRLGRNGVGVELVPWVVDRANWLINMQPNDYGVVTKVLQGDSQLLETRERVREALKECGTEKAHLLILHPPYHDIIKFSDLKEDLSNAKSEEEFYERFEMVVENYTPLLGDGRYLVLVVGDKYTKGEWVPLGFKTMERVLRHGYKLKSICVKDIQENRGKRNQLHLWRYRALKEGFYIFKHEYIIFFQKC